MKTLIDYYVLEDK